MGTETTLTHNKTAGSVPAREGGVYHACGDARLHGNAPRTPGRACAGRFRGDGHPRKRGILLPRGPEPIRPFCCA